MADTTITALAANTTPLVTDIVPMVDDPTGTPVTQKITFANVLSLVYPIGSVFTSIVSTSPATLFGFGTWAAFGAGKMLIGLDSADVDFDTAEETGGAKTVTIGQTNLPNISTGAGTSHNHTQNAHGHTQDAHNHTQDTHNHTQNAHTHVITELRDATTGGATTNIALTADTTSTLGTKVTGSTTPTNNTVVATNQAATATNQVATPTNNAEAAHTHSLGGSGTALNVMNPYIVVYMWKRTA